MGSHPMRLLGLVVELSLPTPAGDDRIGRHAREVCRPFVELLERRPAVGATVAVDRRLARDLLRLGHAGVLQALAAAAERGQVELAAVGHDRALLPLLPRREIARQLALAHDSFREWLGQSFRPQGLFPTDLAYARPVAELAADRGLRWVLCDELALGRLGQAPVDRLAMLRGRPDILLHFRDRALSRDLTAALAARRGRGRPSHATVVVPPEELLRAEAADRLPGVAPRRDLSIVSVGTISSVFPEREPLEPLPSSARTSLRELSCGTPFAPWSAPDNELQALLWRLARIGWSETARLTGTVGADVPEVARLRALLDEALDASTFRMASCRPYWDPAMVRTGAARLFRALSEAAPLLDRGARTEATELHERIGVTVETWERSGLPRRLAADAPEEDLSDAAGTEAPPRAPGSGLGAAEAAAGRA